MNCDFQDLHSGDTVVFDLEKSDEGQDIAKNVRLAGALEFN
jgi:cold shock CspA family protein